MNEEKAGNVQWIQDSSGTMTCHINDGKLNFKDSLIGTLDYRSDGWHIILKDKTDLAPKGLPSLARARDILAIYSNQQTKLVMTSDDIKTSRTKPRTAQPGKSWDEIKKYNWDQ
jgi:hypothetical protein